MVRRDLFEAGSARGHATRVLCTLAPAMTCCSPFTTTISAGPQAVLHHAQSIDSRSEVTDDTRACRRVSAPVHISCQVVADGALIDEDRLVAVVRHQFDAREQAGVKRPSLLSNTARTWMVLLRASTLLSTNPRPCADSLLADQSMNTGLASTARRFDRRPSGAARNQLRKLRYVASSVSKYA